MEEGAKVCCAILSTAAGTSAHSNVQATQASVTSVADPGSLRKAVVKIFVKGVEIDDNGNSESFIHPDLAEHHGCTLFVSFHGVNLSVLTSGFCLVNLRVDAQDYQGVRLVVLPQLCSDVVLGLDFQRMHDSVTFKYGGGL